jgi:hypothetical protein
MIVPKIRNGVIMNDRVVASISNCKEWSKY